MDGWMGCGFEGENPLLFLRRAVVGAPFGYEFWGGVGWRDGEGVDDDDGS